MTKHLSLYAVGALKFVQKQNFPEVQNGLSQGPFCTSDALE